METSSKRPTEPRQVPIQLGTQREETPSRRTETTTSEKPSEYGKKGPKTEGQGEQILNKTLRPLGVTSIRSVEITNRQYTPTGSNTYVKNREGVYQNLDVSNFLNHADLKLTFTLPYDVNSEELAFCHQKSACPIVNPLLHCQCTLRIGLLEPVQEMCKEREFVSGRACKNYVVELPLIRTLALDPFNPRFYTLRIAGIKLPELTEVFWRIHLKVCPADNVAEVISISDHPFDVNAVQENLTTLGDRFNDMLIKPLKRRGWFPLWGRRETVPGTQNVQPQGQKPQEPQYQQSVYSSV